MLNDTQRAYIKQLCHFLPDRKQSSTGRKPIKKEVLVREYFKLVKNGLGWREIRHASTVRSYIEECQRRGLFKKFLEHIVQDELAYRQKITIIDACDLLSWNVSKETGYSSKNCFVATKLSLEVTENFIPIDFRFDNGKHHDKYAWNKWQETKDTYPYKLYMDKGYEDYAQRKKLRKINCQVKIEPKKFKHSKKRGPYFQWSKEDGDMRRRIESVFSWIQSFQKVRLRKERKDSIYHAFVITSLSYYAF